MIQFPANLLLYVYLGIMGILLVISFVNIFYSLRFTGMNAMSIFTTGLFIAGVLVIVWASDQMLLHVDWSGFFHINLPSVRSLHFS